MPGYDDERMPLIDEITTAMMISMPFTKIVNKIETAFSKESALKKEESIMSIAPKINESKTHDLPIPEFFKEFIQSLTDLNKVTELYDYLESFTETKENYHSYDRLLLLVADCRDSLTDAMHKELDAEYHFLTAKKP